jgi:hypothetical protein
VRESLSVVAAAFPRLSPSGFRCPNKPKQSGLIACTRLEIIACHTHPPATLAVHAQRGGCFAHASLVMRQRSRGEGAAAWIPDPTKQNGRGTHGPVSSGLNQCSELSLVMMIIRRTPTKTAVTRTRSH